MNLTVGDYAPLGVKALEIKTNGAVEINDHVSAENGYDSVDIAGRDPSVSFDMAVEATLAGHNPFSEHGAIFQIMSNLGTESGNSFYFVLPAGQAKRANFKTDGKKLKYSREYLPTGGVDDELFIIYS
ncbi:MAG: hypothetical protein GY862_12535 [Gammaproteobacteria bacterium]|nr:hypothetical protein [Gammaproteobacteria bacterium]